MLDMSHIFALSYIGIMEVKWRKDYQSFSVDDFSRDLFNSAFLACWTELTELQQDEVIASLEKTLTSQEIPEIMQTLLNLAEFMEHCDKVGHLAVRILLLHSCILW